MTDNLLGMFGSNYVSNASSFMKIMIIAAVPLTINVLYIAFCRIREKNIEVLIINTAITIITLFGSIFFLEKFGLFSIGFSWLTAQTIVTTYILLLSISKRYKFRD